MVNYGNDCVEANTKIQWIRDVVLEFYLDDMKWFRYGYRYNAVRMP